MKIFFDCAGVTENSNPLSNKVPVRVIIHGHSPDENASDENTGKLVHVPKSIEDLFKLAGKQCETLIKRPSG